VSEVTVPEEVAEVCELVALEMVLLMSVVVTDDAEVEEVADEEDAVPVVGFGTQPGSEVVLTVEEVTQPL
jgi:hypothetical protein